MSNMTAQPPPKKRKKGAAKRARPPVAAAGPGLSQIPAPSGTTDPRRRERAVERAVTAFAAMVIAGLALVGASPSSLGMGLCLAGLIGLIAGVHTYGRLGPDVQAR